MGIPRGRSSTRFLRTFPKRLRDRNIDLPLYEGAELEAAFERHLGDHPYSSERAEAAIARLWLDVAAALTHFDWKRHVDVTGDFVALAYPVEPAWFEVRRALRNSLEAERDQEFEANGWIPEQLRLEPSDPT